MKYRLLVFSLFLSSGLYAQGFEKNFIDKNYIEVTGKSEMEITPDEIYIKVLIDEKDTKNKTSVTELEQSMIKKLEEIGIDVSKDLLMKDISSNFKDYLLSKEYERNLRYDQMQSNRILIRGMSSQAMQAESLPANIEFEKIKLEYTILCRFELK